MLPFIALTKKEIYRFTSVWVQTLVGPMSTALLYQLIFGSQLSSIPTGIPNVSYPMFLIPGLIMMQVLINSFSNSTSSLIQSKYLGNIVFILMAPITPLAIYLAYLIASIFRGILVGTMVFVTIYWFGGNIPQSPLVLLYFLLMGSSIMGAFGVISGVLCTKFDQISAVQSFIVVPLTYLSGIFFNISLFPDIWRKIAMLNPFLYIVEGFRYGFIKHTAFNLSFGIVFVGCMAILVNVAGYLCVRRGIGLKR